MKGDEIFYCKVIIDEQEYVQELKVIQGNEVLYEDDFEGFIIGELYTSNYEVVENELFSGGTAIKFLGKSGTVPAIQFNVNGKKIDMITMVPVVEEGLSFSSLVGYKCYSDKERVNSTSVKNRMYNLLEVGVPEWKAIDTIVDFENYQDIYIDIYIADAYVSNNVNLKPLNRSNEFYLDAIIVYR